MTAVFLDLARDLRELVEPTLRCRDADELLALGVSALRRLAPSGQASALLLDGDALVVRAADGEGCDGVRGLRVPLRELPDIGRALSTQRPCVVDGGRSPVRNAMVVPLCVAERCFGVVAVDGGDRCFTAVVVEAVEVYARILALALDAMQRPSAVPARARDGARDSGRAVDDDDRGLVSADAGFARVLADARAVARASTSVLITGETGTGKERLARFVHAHSDRAAGPFVAVNCAALPEGLLESELFGHVRGAFSGAVRDRAGRFVAASGGTLLLDEIGDLPLALQAKLLRVLQERAVAPLGCDRAVRVDVRIVAATHRDLRAAVRQGTFREDLYYRLAVFPLHVPPLRARTADLPALCAALLDEQAGRTRRRGLRLTPRALARLAAHSWPGNVRELENVLERAAVRAAGDVLDVDAFCDLGDDVAAADEEGSDRLDDVVRAHIAAVVARCGGRVYGEGGAAAVLGVAPSTLQDKMKKLGLSTSPTTKNMPSA